MYIYVCVLLACAFATELTVWLQVYRAALWVVGEFTLTPEETEHAWHALQEVRRLACVRCVCARTH